MEIWKIIARRDTGSWERYWDLGEILGSRRDSGSWKRYWELEEILGAGRDTWS